MKGSGLRVNYWEHEDGDEAAIAAIKGALDPVAAQLSKDNWDVYPGIDFYTWIRTEGLSNYAVMLTGLMDIDSRGGYFRQSHMCQALKRCLEEKRVAGRNREGREGKDRR